MANTTNLGLPLMAAAQSQKHVTHNDALLSLDALTFLSVKNETTTVAPGSPAEGDRYCIGSGATGAWAGKDLNIAHYTSGAWVFFAPKVGWELWNEALSVFKVWNGTAWVQSLAAIAQATAAHGGSLKLVVAEALVTLSGATTTPALQIPANCILLAVSNRVVTAITGATSYNCGTSGTPTQFGGSLDISLGATNYGMIGPSPYYAATGIVYTAVGGSFTGGQVRMTIHYLAFDIASS